MDNVSNKPNALDNVEKCKGVRGDVDKMVGTSHAVLNMVNVIKDIRESKTAQNEKVVSLIQ